MSSEDQLAARLYAVAYEVNTRHGLGDYRLPWEALADDDYAREEFAAMATEALAFVAESLPTRKEIDALDGLIRWHKVTCSGGEKCCLHDMADAILAHLRRQPT